MITPIVFTNYNVNKYQYSPRKFSNAASNPQIKPQRDEFVKDVSFTGWFGLSKVKPPKKPLDVVYDCLMDYNIDYTKETADQFVEALSKIKDVRLDELINDRLELRCVLSWLRDDKFVGRDQRKFATHFILEHLDEYNPSILESLSYYMPKCFLHEHELKNYAEFIKKINKNYYDILAPSNLEKYYDRALKVGNSDLLKVYVEDLKLQPCQTYNYWKKTSDIIERGRFNSNPEIVELFNDKNLYELMKTNPEFGRLYSNNSRPKTLSILANAFMNEEKNLYKKYGYINKLLSSAARTDNKTEICSEFPVAPFERRDVNYCTDSEISHLEEILPIPYINRLRVEKLIERNIPDKDLTNPENLLKCLNDSFMSPELLTKNYRENSSILSHIASIPVTEQNKKIMSEIVNKIKSMGYMSYRESCWTQSSITDLLGQTAELAARNNNVELLEYFKSIHLNLNECLDLNSLSPEVKKVLADVKPQDTQLPTFADATSPEAFKLYLKKYPQYDINSRDGIGESLLLKAVKKGNLKILEELKNIDDVDWNITDSFGKNAAMLAIDLIEKEPKKSKAILENLKNLPDGKFDINYINPCILEKTKMPANALTYSLFDYSLKGVDDILSFKNLDVNNHAQGTMPPLFIIPARTNHDHFTLEIFKKLLKKEGLDLGMKFEGKTLREALYSGEFENIQDTYSAELFEKRLDNAIAKRFVNKMSNVYNDEGTFTLEQIKDYLNFGKLDLVKNEPLNILGDRIVHFLPEITGCDKDYNIMKDVNDIFETLKKNDFDFDVLNDIGDSALKKAVEAENVPIVNMLVDFGSHPKDLNDIIKLAQEINNPEINNILKNVQKK